MRVLLSLACAALVAGCSGGDDDSGAANPAANPASPAPPAPTQSAGGIWIGLPATNESATFYIAETGELIVQTTALGTTPPGIGFGSGAVIVNNPNDVAGTYTLRSLPSGPLILGVPPPQQTCTLDGTVTERSLMQVTVSCTEGTNTTDRTFNMLYNPAYDTDSSLADIAGNYTVPFRPQTNTLNINASGVVFGMLDNGPTCTINGQVQIIDARFNLYRFEIQLSLCQGITGQLYNGTTFRGFAARNLLTGTRPGTFILLLTGTSTINGPFQFFSLLYEPV
jgi:hypothetical protein